MIPEVYFTKNYFHKPGRIDSMELSVLGSPIVLEKYVERRNGFEWNTASPHDVLDLGIMVSKELARLGMNQDNCVFNASNSDVLKFSDKGRDDNIVLKSIAFASINGPDFILAMSPIIAEVQEYDAKNPKPYRFEHSVIKKLSELRREVMRFGLERKKANAYVVGNPVSYEDKKENQVNSGSGIRHIAETIHISQVPIAVIDVKDRSLAVERFGKRIHFI